MTLTCLVTIHGIGFQQPPLAGNPGYADDLHAHLAAVLGPALGDDPQRRRTQRGEAGPVYVESLYPAPGALPSVEEGLKRLGSWDPDHPGTLLSSPPPLVVQKTKHQSVMLRSSTRTSSSPSHNLERV